MAPKTLKRQIVHSGAYFGDKLGLYTTRSVHKVVLTHILLNFEERKSPRFHLRTHRNYSTRQNLKLARQVP